jgi:hypothetical protein
MVSKILRTTTAASPSLATGTGSRSAGTSYQVQVRMQDGNYRNFNYSTQPPVQVGERVRVSGDSLTAL